MTEQPVFLGVDHVLEIHDRVIREFGGDSSVRDRGLLESAVRIPRATFGGEYLHDSIPTMAAAYLFHLCMNHPFVDGNKRTAVATAEVFLLLNDMHLGVEDSDLYDLTMDVAASRVAKEGVIAFFAKYAAPQ